MIATPAYARMLRFRISSVIARGSSRRTVIRPASHYAIVRRTSGVRVSLSLFSSYRAGFNAVNAKLTIPLRSDYRYRIAPLGPPVPPPPLSLSLSLCCLSLPPPSLCCVSCCRSTASRSPRSICSDPACLPFSLLLHCSIARSSAVRFYSRHRAAGC